MELRNIRTFITITKEKSFSVAASKLGYTQSTVTMQIQQLEEELQTKLFERIGRKVQLTEKGETFLHYANEIIQISVEATDRMLDQNVVTGTLRIGVVESLCTVLLPNILKEFHIKYPDVEIVITVAVSSDLPRMIKENEIDFALILDYPRNRDPLISYLTVSSPLVFLAGKENPLTLSTGLCLTDLSQEIFILTEKNCSYRSLLDNSFLKYEIHPHLFLELGNTEIIKNFVSNNLAITLLPKFTAKKEIENRTLLVLDVINYDLETKIEVLLHKNKTITKSMDLFLKRLKKHLMP